MIKDVPVSQIMVSPVITAHVNAPFSDVEEKLRRKGIRHLPIVDDAGRVLGLITQRDLFRILSPHIVEAGIQYDQAALNAFVLKRVMTPKPMTLRPEDPLSKLVEMMIRNKYGCCPIVNEIGILTGIVTEIDVLKYLAKQFY